MVKEFKTNNFDLLRLFAACEVLLLHSYWHLNIPYPAFFKVLSNFPGVTMFFVMSGYLISGSLERNRSLQTYFKNRALRIYPALCTCIIITIPIIAIVGKINFLNLQTIPWFLCQFLGLIYTPKFLSQFGFGSYNGSLWTIPLELQFYICLPIIYFILSNLVKKESFKSYFVLILCIIFCILTYLIRIHYNKGAFDSEDNVPKVLRYSFIPNIYLFLFGVTLQRFKIYNSNFIFGKGLVWLVVYLLISYFVPTTNETYIFKLLFLGVTTVSLAYTMPNISNKLFKGNDISYGVYIYHGLILGVFVEVKLLNNPYYAIGILLITVILATLSWYFIEKPFIRKKIKTIHPVVAS